MAWLAAQRSTRVLVGAHATGHADIGDALVVFQLPRKSASWTGLRQERSSVKKMRGLRNEELHGLWLLTCSLQI